MATRWTEWTGALAWAEALTDWYRVIHADSWPADEGRQRDEAARTMLLLAFAIQAAARLSGRTVTSSPDDLGRVRLSLIEMFIDVRTSHTVLHCANEGIGPAGGKPGGGSEYARLLKVAGSDAWPDLVSRAASVIRAHRAEIDPDDVPVFDHTLSARRGAVALAAQQLYEPYWSEDY